MENYFLLQNMNDTKLHESMDNENLFLKWLLFLTVNIPYSQIQIW